MVQGQAYWYASKYQNIFDTELIATYHLSMV